MQLSWAIKEITQKNDGVQFSEIINTTHVAALTITATAQCNGNRSEQPRIDQASLTR